MSNESDVAGRIVGLLAKNDQAIVTAWADAVVTELRGRVSRGELERELRALLDAVVAGVSVGSLQGLTGPFEAARSLLTELSHGRARQGFSPRETCLTVFALKDSYLRSVVGTEGSEDVYEDFPAFSRLVDDLGLFTFETFVAAREQIIIDQADQLLELSTPVVKLWDGVLAVPLIGTLDSARTQVVMEKLLQALVDTGSTHAIIDITGVPAVDTQVAQHLLKTVAAARLMGADCIISGIRPQIAQTMVGLGIEFGDIRTKATLADALVVALQALGVAVASPRGRRDA